MLLDFTFYWDSSNRQDRSLSCKIYLYTWGKLLSTTGSLKDTIGRKNLYRYRGYRYDSDTGLYYLNSRYYNPEWRSVVNADNFGGDVGDLLSHNAFAYCKKNPISNSDPTGNSPVVERFEQVLTGFFIDAVAILEVCIKRTTKSIARSIRMQLVRLHLQLLELRMQKLKQELLPDIELRLSQRKMAIGQHIIKEERKE